MLRTVPLPGCGTFVSLPSDIFLRCPCILDLRCCSPHFALVRTWPQTPHQSHIFSPQRLKFRQGAKPKTGDMYTPKLPPLQQCVTALIFPTPGLLATWNGSRRTTCSSLIPAVPTSSESGQQRLSASPSASSKPQPWGLGVSPLNSLLRG